MKPAAHSSRSNALRRAARRGRPKSLLDAASIQELLEQTVQETWALPSSPERSAALGVLLQCALKANATRELEQHARALEVRLAMALELLRRAKRRAPAPAPDAREPAAREGPTAL